MDWREHIVVDPSVCHGQACIRGTGIPASAVLDDLAAGLPVAEVLKSYPSLTRESVQAAVALRGRAGTRARARGAVASHDVRFEVAAVLASPSARSGGPRCAMWTT
jgi:uncharacterized protein (DUF433 family)